VLACSYPILNMTKQFYSIGDVALRLGLSEPTIRRAIKSGKLRAVKAANKYRVTEDAISDYLQSATR
jgi:excisionase family DNA binding protein